MAADQYPVMRNPRKRVIAVVLLAVLSVAAFAIVTWPKPTIIIYTYESFMQWGADPDTIDDEILGPFEREHGVDVQIVRLQTDANGIVSRLVAEAQNPVADVVIGIDNILILQEQALSVLTPYEPENLTLIDPELVNALDPEHYVSPFDVGIVTIVYSTTEVNETTYPQLSSLTFQDLASPAIASMLVTENPHLSSPGLSFLLSEIAVQEKMLGLDWTQWWTDTKNYVDVQEGWSEAWSVWDTDPGRSLLVSYGTDPAYSAYYLNATPQVAVAPYVYNDTSYAWMQIEGIGLVKNGPNPTMGQALIDYFLSVRVQQYIGLNQWMLPVNPEVVLHPAFDYAVHPDDITPLNLFLTREEIAANLSSWLTEWDLAMSG